MPIVFLLFIVTAFIAVFLIGLRVSGQSKLRQTMNKFDESLTILDEEFIKS